MRICLASFGLVALSVAVLGGGRAVADTVTLTPVADTSLFEHDPNNNLGGLTSLPAGTIRTLQRSRALFKFDLTQIPASATITSAVFGVQVVAVPPAGASSASIFELHRVLRDWGEGAGAGTLRGSPAGAGEATWNNRFHPSTPWTPPGGGPDVDYVRAFSATNFINSFGSYTFNSTPGLVADVQAWVDSPATSFGWMLMSQRETTSESARRFGSREDPSHAPVLVVGFVLGPKIITQPQSQTVPLDSTVSFSVTVSGTPPVAYQWQSNGVPIFGETNSTLVLSNVQTSAAGQYSVLVTDQNGTVASKPATLTVIAPGQPLVSILSPTNESRFPDGSQVLVTAEASETNGSISQVEFFLNTTNSFGVAGTTPGTNFYSALLTNVAAGTYALSAVATDPRQVSVTSSIVNISFVAPPAVTVTVSPPGTNFLLGTTLTIAAHVTTGVTNVVFFEGVRLLTNLSAQPFSFAWTPTEPRLYSVTARATDDFGQSSTSPRLVIRVHGPDSVAPRLTITNAPPNFSQVTNASVFIAGTASDANLDHVEYQVTSGPFLEQGGPAFSASGTSNWLALVTLQPGQNQVRLRSLDFSTNSSGTLSRFYTYVVPASLVVQTNGQGTLSPDLTRKVLELGQLYTVTARPARGFVFQSWEGPGLASTNNAALSFVIVSNGMTLVANFVTNPFPAVAGTYKGLFLEPSNVQPDSSGTFALQLGQSGSFSGKLGMNGTSYPFNGKFNLTGASTVPVLRHALPPTVLGLQLDRAVESGKLGGWVTNLVGTNIVVSEVLAERNLFNASSNPAPQAGTRRFTLRRGPDHTEIGRGQATIAKSGTVKIQGLWSNNLRFALSTVLFAHDFDGGNVPFYLSYYGGTEIIIGLPNFRGHPDDISGVLSWVLSGTNAFSTTLEFAPLP